MRDFGVPNYSGLVGLLDVIIDDFKKNRSRYPKIKSDVLEWAAIKGKRVAVNYMGIYESHELAIGIPVECSQGRQPHALGNAVVAYKETERVSLIPHYKLKPLNCSIVYVLTPRTDKEFLATLPPLHVVSEFVEKVGSEIKNTELQMDELGLLPEVRKLRELSESKERLEENRKLVRTNLEILESILGKSIFA